jgi:hypothetical protein
MKKCNGTPTFWLDEVNGVLTVGSLKIRSVLRAKEQCMKWNANPTD